MSFRNVAIFAHRDHRFARLAAAMGPFGLLNARPRREVLIRTRAPYDEVLGTVRRFVDGLPVEAEGGPFADGFLTRGAVGKRDFAFDYRTNNPRNSQGYAVYGVVQEGGDWRTVRLTVTADAPWLGVGALAVLVLFLAYDVLIDRMPVTFAAGGLVFVCLVYLVANGLWIPDVVSDKVGRRLAHELRGSVRERGQWVVPQDQA